ncbi:MAG: hypothetical protein ACRDN0_08715 [Trebonia sp.]
MPEGLAGPAGRDAAGRDGAPGEATTTATPAAQPAVATPAATVTSVRRRPA